MIQVSVIWRWVAIFILGACFGIFISLKWISPPTDDIRIGNITIKAKRGSTVEDAVDLTIKPSRKERRRLKTPR